MTPYDNFQMNIVNARVKNNLSQAELAKKAGLTARTVERLETGELKPGVSSALRIADALGITLDKLFGLSPQDELIVYERTATPKEIASKVKLIREQSRLKHYQFAESLGITRRQLLSIEKGVHKPRLSIAFIIKSNYGISLDSLYKI